MKWRLLTLVLLFIVGCVDKLQAARTAAIFGKAATEIAATGFTTAGKVKATACSETVCKKTNPVTSPEYRQCLAASHVNNAEWVACYAPMAATLNEWTKIKPMIDQSWKVVDAVLIAAAQVKDKQQLDYFTPIKTAVCLLTKAATYLPVDAKKKVAWLIAAMVGFGCY